MAPRQSSPSAGDACSEALEEMQNMCDRITHLSLEAWLTTLNVNTARNRARLNLMRRGLADGRKIHIESQYAHFELRLDARGCFELAPLHAELATV